MIKNPLANAGKIRDTGLIPELERSSGGGDFCAAGYPAENAAFIANSLVFADIRGVSSHGVARIKSYMERAVKEHWNADPQLTYQEKGAICLIDGDDGFGSIVGTRAMKKAVEPASTCVRTSPAAPTWVTP